jgi:hypothetical protein
MKNKNMKNKLMVLIFVFMNIFVQAIFAEEKLGDNLTITQFGLWSVGEMWVSFAEKQSDMNWLNGYRFSSEFNTSENKKLVMALMATAISNGK